MRECLKITSGIIVDEENMPTSRKLTQLLENYIKIEMNKNKCAKNIVLIGNKDLFLHKLSKKKLTIWCVFSTGFQESMSFWTFIFKKGYIGVSFAMELGIHII